METARELMELQKNALDEVEALITLGMDTEEADRELETIKRKILVKTENIDAYINSFDLGLASLAEQKKMFLLFAESVNKKIEVAEKHKSNLIQYLGDVGIVKKGNNISTSTHTYYVQERAYVNIEDQSMIPIDYYDTKIEQVLNKRKVNAEASSGVDIPGVSVNTKSTVCRRAHKGNNDS